VGNIVPRFPNLDGRPIDEFDTTHYGISKKPYWYVTPTSNQVVKKCSTIGQSFKKDFNPKPKFLKKIQA
jgi:hypothetical protein